jgi:hypothetical protein
MDTLGLDLKYFMGDYEARKVSLQKAEERIRKTSLHLD